jgi:RNA polymerase sigma-70 factor (ECF subfamily)
VRARRPSESLADDAIDEQPGPEEAAAHDQDDRLMQGALIQLKAEYRVVIVLKHLQGCAYEEIAEILACPVKTVKSRLFTARQALRDVLLAMGRL